MDFHTNITRVMRDEQILFQGGVTGGQTEETDRSVLNVEEIIQFADCLDVADVEETLGRQIDYNSAISDQGLKGGWGAEVGKTLRTVYGDSLPVRARAAAAAGSDARMSGCELPVIIVSGSGNQGMTASLPVIEYARDRGASRGGAAAGSCGGGSGHHPSEDQYRTPVRLLWGGQRRQRRRRRHCLSGGRPV